VAIARLGLSNPQLYIPHLRAETSPPAANQAENVSCWGSPSPLFELQYVQIPACYFLPASPNIKALNQLIETEGYMQRKQILELALLELQRQKAGINADIEAIRTELESTGSVIPQTPSLASAGTRRGRQRTPAQRKQQSLRMRKIWAARRAQAAKPAVPAKTAPAAASMKSRTMTAAQKKALSLKMREVWKMRKAAEAKRAKAK